MCVFLLCLFFISQDDKTMSLLPPVGGSISLHNLIQLQFQHKILVCEAKSRCQDLHCSEFRIEIIKLNCFSLELQVQSLSVKIKQAPYVGLIQSRWSCLFQLEKAVDQNLWKCSDKCPVLFLSFNFFLLFNVFVQHS